jgi:hypothetical protein
LWSFGYRRVRGAGVAVSVAVARGTIIMAMKNSSSEEPRPAAIEKKPYEKPGFRYEQVFVTSALSCGKLTSTQSGCSLNTKVS